MKYPKRNQYKYAKSRCRARNWPEYEVGLQRRGDLTVWLSDAALDSWRAPPSGKPGGQRTYADIAIEAARTIRVSGSTSAICGNCHRIGLGGNCTSPSTPARARSLPQT